jgi:thiosulfate/3-mercaptopyruvate sulfurtransferase
MKNNREHCLTSTAKLAAILDSPDLVVVDASWYLPTAGRDARAEYLAEHIPGAVFFDIDEIADTTCGLPHMLPDPLTFSQAMQHLGIGDGMRVVVYDSAGLFSAPRVWWTLRAFGVRDVTILDGGLPAWRAESHRLESGPVTRRTQHFRARPDHSLVSEIEAVMQALDDGSTQVIDARPADRFGGTAPEPRPGLQCGHMPGSINVPATELIADGRLKDPDGLLAIFESANVNLTKPTITSCGSGVTAAIILFALATLGSDRLSLYDGSWAEWGARSDTPISLG